MILKIGYIWICSFLLYLLFIIHELPISYNIDYTNKYSYKYSYNIYNHKKVTDSIYTLYNKLSRDILTIKKHSNYIDNILHAKDSIYYKNYKLIRRAKLRVQYINGTYMQ